MSGQIVLVYAEMFKGGTTGSCGGRGGIFKSSAEAEEVFCGLPDVGNGSRFGVIVKVENNSSRLVKRLGKWGIGKMWDNLFRDLLDVAIRIVMDHLGVAPIEGTEVSTTGTTIRWQEKWEDTVERVAIDTEMQAAVARAAIRTAASLGNTVEMEPSAGTCAIGQPEPLPLPTISPAASKDHNEMGFPDAWEVSRGSGCRIAVLDTGCRTSHPSIDGRVIRVVNCTGEPGHDRDANGHGTFVTSQILSNLPESDPFGSSREASVVVMGVLDPVQGYGLDSWIARGIDAAVEMKVDVITGSLGGPDPLPLTSAALVRAHLAGIATFFATGNSGSNVDRVAYPARYDGVIGVGSQKSIGVQSSFSQDGEGLDIYAHGENQIGAVGADGYGRWSGTSMATPHAASAAACLIGAARDLGGMSFTPFAVVRLLQDVSKRKGERLSNGDVWPGSLDAGAAIGTLPAPLPIPEPTPTPEPTPDQHEFDGSSMSLMGIAAEFSRWIAKSKVGEFITFLRV